jgi:multiple sugar transport system ATP-binding protein
MAAVSLSAIKKSFGTAAVLNSVSLDIADGEFLTLLGPSGCGKSTLLRIIAGLETQDEGCVAISGCNVDALAPKNRDVAMVFQSYALYPHMTVAQNMTLPLRMRRLNAWQRLPCVGRLLPGTAAALRDIESAVTRTAKTLGMEHLLVRKPGQLSGGQRQRVAVGRAMVRHPAVFLMDEPLSNLDAKLRVALRAEIRELHQRLGVTFIYVTHDQSEAMTMSDRVAVMLEGELIQVASPQTIYADPVDRRVAEFIGSPKINMMSAIVRDARTVDVAGTSLKLATSLSVGDRLLLGIRPEAFHVGDGASQEVFTGRVRMVEHVGSDVFVHLDLPGEDAPLIGRLPAPVGNAIRSGQTLRLGVADRDILMFAEEGRRLRLAESNAAPLRSVAL